MLKSRERWERRWKFLFEDYGSSNQSAGEVGGQGRAAGGLSFLFEDFISYKGKRMPQCVTILVRLFKSSAHRTNFFVIHAGLWN